MCLFILQFGQKKIQNEKGVLSTPDLKVGSCILDEDTIRLVQDFYEDEDISRVCPGKRDFVIISLNGEKISKQRRLVLCNLKEAYQIFKAKYPTIRIGFSRFSTHRPANCVLANSSGTHTICVCIYHQNIKLMFDALKKHNVLPNSTKTYHDIIYQVICKDFNDRCISQNCERCPGTNIIQDMSVELQNRDIEMISFKQWQQVDRCSIESIQIETQQFFDIFCEKLCKLIPHHFIAKEQTKYLMHCKQNLQTNECIMICDFSENYSFVVQDAIQGFHWSNAQCTIHPIAIYYKDENDELQFTSLIAIAESLKHNHIAVRLFLKKSYEFIKDKLPNIKKIFHFSDGAGGQYKNKMTFFNLSKMKEEFDLEAEWHFFATCHGKGPCDALGGVLKRNAAKASLQNNEILTAKQLYDWAVSQVDSKINYAYFSSKDYNVFEAEIKNRYNNVKPIPGTQKYHCFIPFNYKSIIVKEYSFCKKEKYVTFMKK